MPERTVTLAEIDQDEAQKKFEEESRGVGGAVGGIQDAVINFTTVKDFTTFDAEYAWVEGNLVVHFFVTKEMKRLNQTEDGGPTVKQYWLNTFPLALDRASKDFFQADSPRLQAKYTEELASWFFRAQSFGDRLDPDAFAFAFLEHLDAELESPRTPASHPEN